MKCSEIMEVCRKLAPEDCACDWDNPGLLAGRSDKEVRYTLPWMPRTRWWRLLRLQGRICF